jgi:hypothetical protein
VLESCCSSGNQTSRSSQFGAELELVSTCAIPVTTVGRFTGMIAIHALLKSHQTSMMRGKMSTTAVVRTIDQQMQIEEVSRIYNV